MIVHMRSKLSGFMRLGWPGDPGDPGIITECKLVHGCPWSTTLAVTQCAESDLILCGQHL